MTGDRLFLAPDAVGAAPQVDIVFAGGDGARTYPKRQRVAYPFHLGRALYLPGDPPEFCTVYLQSCSGGIFQHDRLSVSLKVGARARAHVTTAAATVVHSMTDGHAEQSVCIEAGPGGIAEYLPDPLILFPTTRLASRVVVRAHPDATVILSDSFLAHDPQGGDAPFDWLRAETRVETEVGELLAVDRFAVAGTTVTTGQTGVQAPRAMQATVMVVHRADPEAALGALRSAVPEGTLVFAGASLLPGGAGAWMRAMSNDAVALRRTVHDAWGAMRERVTGTRPGPRRK